MKYGMRMMAGVAALAAGAAMAVYMTSVEAEAAPYYRFWRGWKAQELQGRPFGYGEFLETMNRQFFPYTIEMGAGRGLVSYLPALPATPGVHRDLRARGVDLPDEVALIVYGSEPEYRALRATPEGQEYARLHTDYFDMSPENSKSRSLVPIAYDGEVAFERAYDVLESRASWRHAPEDRRGAKFLIRIRDPRVGEAEYLRTVRDYLDSVKQRSRQVGLVSHVILVAHDYLIEYQLWSERGNPRAFDSLVAPITWRTIDPVAQPVRAGDERHPIRYGQALNAQF